MSPTIPPVLVLSLLLLPPPAEAEEMMDPFALIRETLKYWRRIYKMYHEEVTLGYCWAEYFLRSEDTAMNEPVSRTGAQDWSNFASTGVEFSTETRKDWLRSLNDPRVRIKRSYEIFDPANGDGEISIKEGSLTSEVYSKTGYQSLDCRDRAFARDATDRVSTLNDVEGSSSFLPSSLVASNGVSTISKKTTERNTEELSARKFETPRVNSKTECDLKDQRRNKSHRDLGVNDVKGSFYFLPSSSKDSRFEISKSPKSSKNDNWIPATQKFASSKIYSKITDRFSREFLNNGVSFPLSLLNKSRKISKKSTFSKNNNGRLFTQKSTSSKVYWKSSGTRYDLKSMDFGSHEFPDDDSIGRSSVPFSLNIFDRGSLSPSKGGEIVETMFDSKLKGSRTEDDRELGGKSKSPEVDSRRKVPYRNTRRGASGCPSRRVFALKVFHSGGQKSTDARSPSLGQVASYDDTQFNGDETTEKLNDNKERGELRCGREFDSSRAEFQEAGERPNTLERSYQRNLRRKRDANDRMGGLLARTRTKNTISSHAMAYFHEFRKSRTSSVYTVPENIVWGALTSKNNGAKSRRLGNNTGPESGKKIDGPVEPTTNSSPIYSKYYKNIPRRNKHRSSVSTDIQVLPATFEKPYNVSSPLVDNPWTVRPSPNYVFPKIPIENRGQKREFDWNKTVKSIQLLSVNDNRYQRTELPFPPEKSIVEEAGRKEPIRDPVGRPSLLPVSYQRFMGDYRSPTSGTSQNSRPRAKNQGRRSSSHIVEARGLGRTLATLFNLRAAFMTFLRSLGFFVQVGRQIMDYVESNTALVCTKDYLLGKVVEWIDS